MCARSQVKHTYFAEAPAKLAAHLQPLLSAHAPAPAASDVLTAVCVPAVAKFKALLSADAEAILSSSDGKDYAVDVQNAILAFAGRVLLRGCDLRFERGRRYGLIGQNGVGKTTLLNRLAAKDITGFPLEIKVRPLASRANGLSALTPSPHAPRRRFHDGLISRWLVCQGALHPA